jgi:hypothetical protein
VVLIVDAANVVGSRPNGWWRDRPKAAAELCRHVVDAVADGRLTAPVVVVLEGQARHGVAVGDEHGVRVVHASGSGDDAIVDLVAQAVGDGEEVTVATADRELRVRTQQTGGEVVGPRWLTDLLDGRASRYQ